MKDKVALYSLGIGIMVLGGLIFGHLANGEPIPLGRLGLVVILPPIFAYLIWLRWDWAPKEGRKARAARNREKDQK